MAVTEWQGHSNEPVSHTDVMKLRPHKSDCDDSVNNIYVLKSKLKQMSVGNLARDVKT